MVHNVEVLSVPCISTTHLSEEVAAQMAAMGDEYPFMHVAPYEYGFFVCLGTDIDPDAPKCVRDLWIWANTNGACWVRLDSDCPEVDLPTYVW